MKQMLKYIYATLWLAASHCSPQPREIVGGDEGEVRCSPTHSIAALKSIYIGGSQPIVEPIVIEGVITANNIYGEFPNLLIIEDESGAIEMCVEFDDGVEYDYKIGATMTIICSELYLAARGGVVVLGSRPTQSYIVDNIAQSDLVRYSSLSAGGVPAPRSVVIGELSKAMISCYVRLEGVSFATPQRSYCDFDSERGEYVATTHLLCDEAGDMVELYVPSSVLYRAVATPEGWLSLSVVVDYYNDFSVRMCGYSATPQ